MAFAPGNNPAQLTADGLVALQRGALADAERMLRGALQLDAHNVQAIHGLAIVAHQAGHLQAAVGLFDRAITIDSNFAAAYVNRGNALGALGQFDAAAASYREALRCAPALANVRLKLAGVLRAGGSLDSSVAVMEEAVLLESSSIECRNSLGELYKEQGRLADAVRVFKAAAALDPRQPQALDNLLAITRYDPKATPATLFDTHREWSGWFDEISAQAPLILNPPVADRPLRIGYVCVDADARIAACIDGVIAAHDRKRYQVYAYFCFPQPPQRLAAMGIAETARVMHGLTDLQVAQRIYADGIDILIDLAGHDALNRLGVFARRMAPVQVTWLGYGATTGVSAIDYRMTDAISDPAESDTFHSEKLLRFPHSQYCWQPPAASAAVAPLPADANGYITFGSFGDAIQFTDATLALWRKAFEAMPEAKLIVADVADGFAQKRIRDLTGLTADRLSFVSPKNLLEIEQLFANIDVMLDLFPLSHPAAIFNALWNGVPLMTLAGATSGSRVGASLLDALGLAQWVAEDSETWLLRLMAHCRDVPLLRTTRASLRARLQASPPMDIKSFVRNLESLLRKAWTEWCEQRVEAQSVLAKRLMREPIPRAATDDALQRVRRLAKQPDTLAAVDQAADLMTQILRARPHWEPARSEAARVYIDWACAHPEAQVYWKLPVPKALSRTRVSVIICSIREDYFAHIKAQLAQRFAAHDLEVIGIHDAKSLCEGYNRGAKQSSGDILIFCHDDIDIVHEDFAERLLTHLQTQDVIGIVGASQIVNGSWKYAGLPYLHGQIIHRPPEERSLHAQQMGSFFYLAAGLQQPVMQNIQAIDGVFMAVHRRVWESVGFDEAMFDGFHLYDIDFSYRAFLAGYRIAVPADLLLVHFSLGRYDTAWHQYNRRFLEKFPALSNRMNIERLANIHVKLNSLNEIELLHAALLHHQFGILQSETRP